MSINVNEDVIGGGGLGYGYGGGGGAGLFLFAIIVIFFVAIAGLWGGRGRHDGCDGFVGHRGRWGDEDSCADKLTWSRFANFEDPAIAKIQTEIACTTGQIKTQNALDTGAIIHALDQQTCEIKLGEAAIIQNQLKLAMEAQTLAMQNQIAELREQKLELKGKLLQQETVNTINAGNCQINNRLGQIECGMVKQPPFFAAGGSPFINPFNFQPAPIPVRDRDRDRDDFGRCCC